MSVDDILGQVSGLVGQIGSIADLASASTSPDAVRLEVNSQNISGWTRVHITRSIERIPADFEIELTEKYPSSLGQVVCSPGDPCQVFIGTDLVLTGYIDRFMPALADGTHTIVMVGRSMSQDLVDCSAEWDGGQISGSNAVNIAGKLCLPYSIFVKPPDAIDKLAPIPQFNLMYGETPAEIIERICKYSALLYYDDVDGDLIMANVSTAKMASGFTEGVNVQSAQAAFTIDQRFATYKVSKISTQIYSDTGGTNFLTQVQTDPDVRPARMKIIVCEAGQNTQAITLARAAWEKNRRYGRAWSVSIVTDSWRDSAGKLWAPNTLVPLNLPSLKIANVEWTIGDVTYSLDDNGTTATLVLMPPLAYSVEPILIQKSSQVEAGVILNPPGGNQNPGAPNLPPSPLSPAVSPAFAAAMKPIPAGTGGSSPDFLDVVAGAK